jgi:hypothetical protein
MQTLERQIPFARPIARRRLSRLVSTLRLALVATVIIAACLPRQVTAQQPPSDPEFEAKLQLFFEQLEERMKDWPREDLSEELPLDAKVHARIQQVCEEVRAATREELRNASWPNAEVRFRSLSYVICDSEKTVEVSYTGTLDAKASNPKVFRQDMHLQFDEGRPKHKRWFAHRLRTGDNVLAPIVERQTQSILESAADAPLPSWPVSSGVHQKLIDEMNHVLNLYLEAFRGTLENAAGVTGRIETIEYTFWFDDKEAKIRVTFDIENTADQFFLGPGVMVDYKQGRFRLKDLIHACWTGGVEYVGDASLTAMDDAIAKWVKTFDADSLFQDARVGPPFQWQENAKDLPNNLGRVVHLMRRSHPFLGGEHDRKFRLELSDRRTRTFTFPADGGLVTKTDVYLVDEDDRQFIRFQDDDRTAITISLDSLKIRPSKRRVAVPSALTFPE